VLSEGNYIHIQDDLNISITFVSISISRPR